MSTTRRIRILQLIADLDIGGTEMVLKSLVEKLNKKQFSVIICSIKPIGQVGHELRRKGFKVLSLNSGHKIAFPIALLRLTKLIQNERIDIVQSYLFPDNILARFAGSLTGAKVINGKRDTDRYKSKYRVALDTLTGNMADCVVSNSLAGVRELEERQISPSKIKLIRSGINIEKYSTKRSHKRFSRNSKISIGVVAKLRFQKGHTYLLDAFKKLSTAYPKAKLVIVGDGPLMENLLQKADAIGIRKQVLFLGDRRDIPELLKKFDIFVLPSLWEGTPRALLEAMASGLLVIATRVDGSAEVIEDGRNGILVPPRDSSALWSAMLKAISSFPLRKSLGTAARATAVRTYSIEKMVKAYERLYIEISRGSSPS